MSESGLTVTLIVRDEADNLREILPALVEGADDVVVVDTGSADGSADVARALGARVFEQPWENDFSAARNRGLDEVLTSHVLWLDADDRLEPDALDRVREEVLRDGNRALLLLLVNESSDPNGVSSCWQLRVFPARPEHRFEGRIHEQIQSRLEATGTPIDRLDVTVRHTGYVEAEEVIRKSRRNLEMLRREMAEGREDDVTVLYHFVQAASRCGELEAATEIARRLVESPPPGTSREILQSSTILLARLVEQRGARDESRLVLDAAVERVPDDTMARFFRADLRRRAGDLAGALQDLEVARACPIRPGKLPIPVAGISRAIRFQMGEILERLERPAEAAESYGEILAARPDDRVTQLALARARIGAGDLDGAERVLDAIEDRPEDRGERLLLRATLAFQRGQSEEARASYERALERMPRAWAAHLHLGHLAMQRLDFPAADAHYERALSLVDNAETRLGRAICQLETNRLPECLENLAAAVEASGDRPVPPGTEAVAGEALFRLGKWTEARGAFEKHLERFGPEARILSRLADCYRELRVPEAARLGYRKALEIDPVLEEARRGLDALETASAGGFQPS